MSTDPDERTRSDAREPDADVGGSGATTLHLASWEDRFWAWLIDVILVGAVVSALGQAAGVLTVLTGGLVTAPAVGGSGIGIWVYWTALEGNRGQSAGKLVMDVAVTDERGDPIDYATAAVESFGKAFLLPLDVLIGWIAMEDEYVRLFNKLSETIVIDVSDADGVPDDVEYVPPDD